MLISPLQSPLQPVMRSPFEHRRGGWSPLALFSSGEQGFIYDPSDMSTLFQDSAGTTPVTGPNQPVGLMLDKSGRGNHATQPTAGKRPMLGREPFGGRRNLLTYTEDFGNAAWTKGSCAVSANKIIPNNGSTNSGIFQPFAALATTAYSWSVYLKQAELSNVRVRLNARTGANAFITDAYVDVNLSAGTISAVTSGTFTSTSASITPAADGYYRVVLSGTTPASTGILWPYVQYVPAGDGVSGWLNGGAQLELGSTATPYQKVVSSFDVTEAGVPDCWYIKGDGIDDFLSTANIDFTATDKMTVWAGVRKLDDTARMVAELSANWTSNNGAFAVESAGGYSSGARGAAAHNANQVATIVQAGADTAVITSTHDIAGDLTEINRNAVAGADATGDKGAGNFGNYPLYLLSRAGSSLFFNGHLYSLIIRGAATDAAGIADGEKWTAKRIGVTLP